MKMQYMLLLLLVISGAATAMEGGKQQPSEAYLKARMSKIGKHLYEKNEQLKAINNQEKREAIETEIKYLIEERENLQELNYELYISPNLPQNKPEAAWKKLPGIQGSAGVTIPQGEIRNNDEIWIHLTEDEELTASTFKDNIYDAKINNEPYAIALVVTTVNNKKVYRFYDAKEFNRYVFSGENVQVDPSNQEPIENIYYYEIYGILGQFKEKQ